MKKYFNIAGPCIQSEHYMIASEKRCKGVMELIEQKQYFVIYAARQSGKTTLLLDLVKKLNDGGKYYALYCTLESVQGIVEPEKGIPAIVRRLAFEVNMIIEQSGKEAFAMNGDFSDYTNVLRTELVRLCSSLEKPLVIFFDEVDCLSNGTLISFLRQLRDGYVNRSRMPFVHSIGLIGMRNIRDYKGKIREERDTLGSASPFNIVTKALTLLNFTEQEVAELYSQHTELTGQVFPQDVVDYIYHYTQGQPWLVNAIVREIVMEILESDYSQKITVDHVEQAVDTIIRRRDTHIDSLLERLKEERVRQVVEPVITGEDKVFSPLDDNLQFVLDLGVLKKDNSRLSPANPIYAEVMVRFLGMSDAIDHQKYNLPAYVEKDRLNMSKLLTDFQQFWRENSSIWQERFLYREAAPHLILMAFLQRVINRGGTVTREMASGRGRLDLCIHYKGKRYPIEIKLRRDAKTINEGKQQLSEYMDTLGCDEGWLVVFDRRKKTSWKSKLFWKTTTAENRIIHVAGC